MKEQIDSAKEAIIEAASNPKVALVVGVGVPGASSAATTLEIITGWTGAITGCLAMCTGAVVLAIQVIKLVREWRAPSKE
jgi:NAD/NADP transhydrogenase alpha subunit